MTATLDFLDVTEPTGELISSENVKQLVFGGPVNVVTAVRAHRYRTKGDDKRRKTAGTGENTVWASRLQTLRL